MSKVLRHFVIFDKFHPFFSSIATLMMVSTNDDAVEEIENYLTYTLEDCESLEFSKIF